MIDTNDYKFRFLLLAVLTLCLFGVVVNANAANRHTYNNGQSFYIMVNRTCNTVTVYGLDETGYYTVPVKAMVCSTGRSGHATPVGTYSVGRKLEWCLMFDGTYGQYSTKFNGAILFHSVCYRTADPATLITQEYNELGQSNSMGCVRLQVADAKWIYDHCAAGTLVTVYDSQDPGPLGKPETAVGHISPDKDNGWEPTDPRGNNPWNQDSLPFQDVSKSAWYYREVQYAYQEGLISGVSDGSFAPNGTVTNAMVLQMLYAMAGSPGNVVDGPWYATALHFAAQIGITNTDDPASFAYDSPVTRKTLAWVLYQYETNWRKKHAASFASLYGFTDTGGMGEVARKAMSWAVGNGVIKGTGESSLSPNAAATRAQAAAIFHQYCLITGR